MQGLLWNWRTMVGALVEALDWPETVVTGIGITALIMLILFLIGRWGIFRKFGEAGWKSLIPYYSQWVEYGYTWNPKIILWNVAAAIVNYIGDVSIIALKKGPILTVAMIAIIVFWICRFAVSAIAAHKLARAFGHGLYDRTAAAPRPVPVHTGLRLQPLQRAGGTLVERAGIESDLEFSIR